MIARIHRIQTRPYLFNVAIEKDGKVLRQCAHRHWSQHEARMCAQRMHRNLRKGSEAELTWDTQ
jgi:hypothetical protein